MRTVFRLALVGCLVLGAASKAVAATTAEQLLALSRAGLDDEVLIALIQTDGSRFVLNAEQILELYQKGLSNRVIRAMIATARRPQAAPPARDAFVQPIATPQTLADAAVAPAPAVPQAEPPSRADMTPPPMVVPPPVVHVDQHVSQHVEVQRPRIIETVTVPVPVYVSVPVVQKKPDPPVYWGWGGQRRPDSWDDGAKATHGDKDGKPHK